MKKVQYMVGLLLVMGCGLAQAVSGNEYRNLSVTQKLAWTVGVADGIIATQLFESGKQPPLAKCLGELEREQIRSIFEKALEGQPDRWHFPAAFAFYDTFRKYCGARPDAAK
jgi:hypothetical protein